MAPSSLLVLLLLAPLALADTLLPETPEGWRYERLAFPLSFAPELGYEGVEELRFAPGMFDPESDESFSYVLALKQYYTGLCRSFASSRGLELDVEAISTEVHFDGRDDLATINMADVFFTTEPLRLRIEVSVHANPDSPSCLESHRRYLVAIEYDQRDLSSWHPGPRRRA